MHHITRHRTSTFTILLVFCTQKFLSPRLITPLSPFPVTLPKFNATFSLLFLKSIVILMFPIASWHPADIYESVQNQQINLSPLYCLVETLIIIIKIVPFDLDCTVTLTVSCHWRQLSKVILTLTFSYARDVNKLYILFCWLVDITLHSAAQWRLKFWTGT